MMGVFINCIWKYERQSMSKWHLLITAKINNIEMYNNLGIVNTLLCWKVSWTWNKRLRVVTLDIKHWFGYSADYTAAID